MKKYSNFIDIPFHIFACCFPVKGKTRGILYDIQRQDFDYIPNDLIDIIEKYEGKTDISNFKYIKKVKDDFPVLTKEMILLSKVMSEELFCTRIQAIETIIPTIFKNKYIEYYELLDPNTTLLIDYAKYFNNNKELDFHFGLIKNDNGEYETYGYTVSPKLSALLKENVK